jgi:hypothetical protein
MNTKTNWRRKMLNWFKGLDIYGWFLFIILGIPGIVLFFHLFGALGIFAYVDFVGKELNWYALAGIIVFMGPVCLAIPVGFMGAFQNSGESAKGFVQGWFGFILATIVLFVIPAFSIIGLKKLGVYDYVGALFA